jgi:DNA-binding transcriptional ArsR family regulator
MPELNWDVGTVYDLFASLVVLHHPANFGLRPAWAAGVRSRVPAAQRETLELTLSILPMPLQWMQTLPEPRDCATAFQELQKIPPAQRLIALSVSEDTPTEIRSLLQKLSTGEKASQPDIDALKAFLQRRGKINDPVTLEKFLHAVSRPVEFGDELLNALQVYFQVFFREEEVRLLPLLNTSLENAKRQAAEIPLPALLEQLTGGVEVLPRVNTPKLLLVPSYWCAPLIFLGKVSAERTLLVFGCRSEDESRIPADQAPKALVRSLKALADPTRLHILHDLGNESLTPTELARRLRLRAPTVVHHLNMLRLCGLVHITLEANGEKRYSLRAGALQALLQDTQHFLGI